MNFEELIETRDKRKAAKLRMPYGFFYKRKTGDRFTNFVEFHDELADSMLFSKGLHKEVEALHHIGNFHQLNFTPNEGDESLFAIAVETGNYTTIEQLVKDDPSIVAKKDFMTSTVKDLMDFTITLNSKGIYHLCFAPCNVLVRKNDQTIRLLNHGSFYMRVDQDVLYEGVEQYVAPEVLNQATMDDRSEVYSLGQFIGWLYESSGLPFELKKIVKKATDENPSNRYQNVEEMAKAISLSSKFRQTGTMALVASALALAIVGMFFYLLPSPDNIEYVKPVKEPIPDEMTDDEELWLGIGADADSATIAKVVEAEKHKRDSMGVDEREMRAYQAKAEAIFRKQFTRAADQILSKVYNKTNMNMSEKEFLVRSKAMTEELSKKEKELAKSSNLLEGQSQRIASEIVDLLTDKKMKEMDKDYMGIKGKKEELENDLKKNKDNNDNKK